MACSKETGEGVMENTPRNPAAFSIPASSIAPASRMTGICCLLASCKMPEGTFPIRVCRSDFPSPVMRRSASLIFSAKSRVSKRSSMPGCNCASRNAWRPPPHTACRTGTGMQGYVFAGSAEYDVRKMLHSNIQFLHHIRVCSFLGSEYVGCSIGTEERIAYITRRRETCLFQCGMGRRAVYGADFR